MWIKAQKKYKKIINMDQCGSILVRGAYLVANVLLGEEKTIGEFETTERAEKVLDKIIAAYEDSVYTQHVSRCNNFGGWVEPHPVMQNVVFRVPEMDEPEVGEKQAE